MKLSLNHAGLLLITAFCLIVSCSKRSGKPKILIFSKTSGFHHESITDGNTALIKLAADNGYEADTTTNAGWFTEDTLKKYSAVVFLNTTGDLLNNSQEAEFERYIQSGGGYVGIHAAADAEYDWGWYGRLAGGYFESHPATQEATLNVLNAEHGSTKHLPKSWKRTDEWYNFKKLNKDVNVLISIDEKSYKGGKNGTNHPMAWYHDYDGGRAFYTELGHTKESFADSLYLKHVLGGIQYAIGDNKEPDYAKAKTQKIPEEDRFIKTVLAEGVFYEPTEMAILPNLDILITQRRGELMLYRQQTKKAEQVGFLNVYFKTTTSGANAEEGLLGIAADPNFGKNNFVYLFYSPADTSVNRLSRFEFKNNKLNKQSEKVVLQFYSQRNICCHTGGSIAFGNDNMLYLSTGDNSTPFDEPNQPYVNHGFGPLDDRPGHEQYDARRSSGNTNDLRGKIIRIKINEDGSYDIPAGNLFKPGQPKTRPEIYVMGNRNPYRISVDKKTNFLYWGEVGPDAGADSLETRGPRGYDELNQARKAGYFGWPLFVGNNYAYHDYDYATGKSGMQFVQSKPINDSKNNTGLTELPPVQPAFIWYPYAESKEFPQVGTGGRNAMAGPAYYTDDFPEETRYPEYYNGKLFIYDWIRNWIKVVTMLPNGDFDKMEPFMQQTGFNAPIDMQTGPDGKIYILEYGKGWFSKNPDAAISRIDYLPGNRPPKAAKLTLDKANGILPFKFMAKAETTDPENNQLTYIWTIGTVKKETKEPVLQHTITQPGDYNISVEVFDEDKASSKSNTVAVYAGNEQPQVDITVAGNQSFYFPGKPVNYSVTAADKGNTIDNGNLFVSTGYIEGKDLAGASMGHQVVTEAMMGRNIMLSSDCKSCHQTNDKSVGPSFTQVAQRYKKDPEAVNYLSNKIIKGGSGVWGEVAMAAHPDLKETDTKQIVNWILSLADEKNTKKSLPPSGKIIPTGDSENKQNTVFALNASYTDAGGAGIRPLSASKALYLRNNSVDVADLNQMDGFSSKDSSGSKYLIFPAGEGWIKMEQIDLAGISSIELTGFGTGQAATYLVEIREGAKDGKIVGKGTLKFGTGKQKTIAAIAVQNNGGKKLSDLYITTKATGSAGANRPLLKTLRFVAGV